MTDKQLKQAIKKYADWDAQKKEMEALKAVIYAELLGRAEKKVEFDGGYIATYVEGYIQSRKDSETVEAFYLLHHKEIPKVEKSYSATVKIYKSKQVSK